MIQYQSQQLIIFESALFRTTSTLIWTDDLLLLVDPNWLPIEIEAIREQVDQRLEGRAFYLLFTHSDYDHIIGWQAFPEAKVICSAAFEQNTTRESILQQIKDFDDENYIKRTYPIRYPKGDIIIADDPQYLQVGNTRLCFHQAPGHNADGLFTLVEPLGIGIAGDYLSNIEFPYLYHSSSAYLQTLDKAQHLLQQQQIRMLIPGHGDYTEEPQEMQRRLDDSYAYIRLLLQCISSNTPFDLNQLWKKYHFPKVMTRFHQGNEELLRKELSERKQEKRKKI